MPFILTGAATQDGYTPECSFQPDKNTVQIQFVGTGADYIARFYKKNPSDPTSKPVLDGVERFYPAGSGDSLIGNIGGVEFRSAVSSTPATIRGVQSFPTDVTSAAQVFGPSPFEGTSLEVTDGTTVVDPVTIIDFVSGAVVTDAGGGQANVAISAGITQITSLDGSVVVTNPFGPVADLSVPGITGFIHWGMNTDSTNLGLTLTGHGNFVSTTDGGDYSIDTRIGTAPGGAFSLEATTATIDAGVGPLLLENFWSSILFNNGPQSITITGLTAVDIATSGTSSRTAVSDIEDRSHLAGNSGGEIYHTVDVGHTVVFRDNTGSPILVVTA